MKSNPVLLLLELVVLIVIRTGFAIRITNLKVPLGGYHEVPIDCQYDLEDTKLYDVKWYKDGEQFFRCLPNGETMDYPVEGIHLYIEGTPRTGSCPLTLIGLSSRTTGEYKCEVTGEAPSFVSAAKSTRFRVMEPPSPRVQNSLKENTEEPVKTTGALEKPDKRVITLLLGHYLFWYLYIY